MDSVKEASCSLLIDLIAPEPQGGFPKLNPGFEGLKDGEFLGRPTASLTNQEAFDVADSGAKHPYLWVEAYLRPRAVTRTWARVCDYPETLSCKGSIQSSNLSRPCPVCRKP